MAFIDATTGGRPESESVELSVVIPCYNEEELLEAAHARVEQCLQRLDATFEIIYVDDGSKDRTYAILQAIQKHDPSVRVIRLSRNFGHQIAITAGLHESSGAAVVILDADLQDPPELIEEMLGRWRAGAQVVYGVRRVRSGESRLRLMVTGAFYRVMSRISDLPLRVGAADFRLMDRSVVDILKQMPEQDRYLRGMVPWIGFKQVPFSYDRDPRMAGERKYTFAKLAKLALDGVTSSANPMLLCFAMAGCILAISLACALAAAFSASAATFVTMAIVGALCSVQLFWQGVLGEYLVRSHSAGRRRPLYIIESRLGHSNSFPGVEVNGFLQHDHEELIHV